MLLFDLASRHMSWLAERQAVTAVNIANADTPGFRARVTNPFSAVLDGEEISMAATSPLHMTASEDQTGSRMSGRGISWSSSHSGNNVSVEQELMSASSASRMMSIDTGLVRSFHRMFLASVKV